jgi:hypothetical protein
VLHHTNLHCLVQLMQQVCGQQRGVGGGTRWLQLLGPRCLVHQQHLLLGGIRPTAAASCCSWVNRVLLLLLLSSMRLLLLLL